MKVLVVDDDAIARKIVAAALRPSYEVVVASGGGQALALLRGEDSPRLVVLDWMMPGLDGLGVCRAIRATHQEPYIYILLLTARDGGDDIVSGLDAGADDYVCKPCDVHELRARLRAGLRIIELQDQLIAAREALREQATHDHLTGVLNRGAILDLLAREAARSERTSSPVTVLMIDVDHFKDVNDMYGHMAGDTVLKEIAWRMRATIRSYDAIGRFGGEEFVVVAPGCDVNEARDLAERLRLCVAASAIKCGPKEVAATVSIGVASTGAAPASTLLRTADQSLYLAKSFGRNRVVAGDQSRRGA
jgi:two-component system cell cycle response regulator